MTDEEREEIQNNPVMTGEDELGGKPEQGATSNEVEERLNGRDDPEAYEEQSKVAEWLDSHPQSGVSNGSAASKQTAESPDEPQDLGDPEQERREELDREMAPLRNSHLKSVGAAADGGGTVVGTGMRLADDRSWEARYNAMQERKRMERAGLKAASMARQQLLDSGRYFDDGRGNIKLKKEFREYQRVGNGGRRTYNETMADDGSGMRYTQKAREDPFGWQDALNAQNAERASASRKKMNDVISLNRESMKMIEAQKAERSKNQARAKFNMVEGYAAAMDALKTELANTSESSFSPIKAWGQGVNGSGKDENGRDARWEYDEKGRVKGQAKAQPTGKYVKRGFVTGPALQALNQRIKEHGGDYQIVGLMATQKFNDVKGTAYGKPVVYARVRTFDEVSGKPMFRTEVFTPERAYELGMETGKAGEIDDYKNLVWQGVGDIHGEREREVAAANLKHTQKLELENAKQKNKLELAEANNKARAEIAEANRKSRETIATARSAALERKKNGGDARFDEKHYNALSARLDALTKDADGNERDPATISPADREKIDRLQAAMDDMLFGRAGASNEGVAQAEGAQAGVVGNETMQRMTQPQSKDSPIPAPQGDSVEHNGKQYTWGWNEEQQRWGYNPVNQQGQAGGAAQPAQNVQSTQQGEEENTGKPVAPATAGRGASIAEEFAQKRKGGAKPERPAPGGEDIDLGDVQESIDRSAAGADDVYRTVSPKLMKRIKDATGATDAEIMSGKYDRQIEALGARMGDDSVRGISDRRKATQQKINSMKSERSRQEQQDALRRKQNQFSIARNNMEQSARDEAEKYGVAHGYDDRSIEERARRSIRRGLIELREKYGLAADGSQDYIIEKKQTR